MELTAYTWSSLATVGGATAATLLIVQYLKEPLDLLVHIPTRLLALIIAFLVLLSAQAFTLGVAWSDVPLIAINSFVVALAAMGSFELTFAETEEHPPKGTNSTP